MSVDISTPRIQEMNAAHQACVTLCNSSGVCPQNPFSQVPIEAEKDCTGYALFSREIPLLCRPSCCATRALFRREAPALSYPTTHHCHVKFWTKRRDSDVLYCSLLYSSS